LSTCSMDSLQSLQSLPSVSAAVSPRSSLRTAGRRSSAARQSLLDAPDASPGTPLRARASVFVTGFFEAVCMCVCCCAASCVCMCVCFVCVCAAAAAAAVHKVSSDSSDC
jgi:hypothetical protein